MTYKERRVLQEAWRTCMLKRRPLKDMDKQKLISLVGWRSVVRDINAKWDEGHTDPFKIARRIARTNKYVMGTERRVDKVLEVGHRMLLSATLSPQEKAAIYKDREEGKKPKRIARDHEVAYEDIKWLLAGRTGATKRWGEPLNDNDAATIRFLWHRGSKQKHLAKMHKVSEATISRIMHNRTNYDPEWKRERPRPGYRVAHKISKMIMDKLNDVAIRNRMRKEGHYYITTEIVHKVGRGDVWPELAKIHRKAYEKYTNL